MNDTIDRTKREENKNKPSNPAKLFIDRGISFFKKICRNYLQIQLSVLIQTNFVVEHHILQKKELHVFQTTVYLFWITLSKTNI